MKKRLIALIVLFTMTTGLPAVQADDRVYRYSDGPANWRLGERVRDGFAIYRNGYRVPGSAIALADGWALGSARESGGFAIFRWNGRHWDQAPGGAVEIGGTYQRPWVINNRGQRYVWNGYDWDQDFAAQNRAQGFNSRRFNQRSDNPFRSWGFSEGGRNFRSDRFRRHTGGLTHRRQRGNHHYRSW